MINNILGIEILPLHKEKHGSFYYNKARIIRLKKSLKQTLDSVPNIHTKSFACRSLIPDGIKTNNEIEGIKDNFDTINRIIHNGQFNSDENKSRIINLFKGYKYILRNRNITKDSLKDLYNILSYDLIDEPLGDKYYRKDKEYITRGFGLFQDYEELVLPENVERLMDEYLNYINTSNKLDEVDLFIKSQIMHFYLVYVHPYSNVNGRTSRTTALWFLINNNAYPFTIFNRIIAKNRKEYSDSIKKSSKTGDLTHFISFMLKGMNKELIIENTINEIENKYGSKLKPKERFLLGIIIDSDNKIETIIQKYKVHDSKYNIEQEIIKELLDLAEKNIIIINQENNDKVIVINEEYLSEKLINKTVFMEKTKK